MPFRYDWRFGDGKMASGVVVEHCYDSPGTYIVQLDVVNLITGAVSLKEKLDTLVVLKIEQPYISAPDSIRQGNTIMLNTDETNLPGWEIFQYYWNFGDETIGIGDKIEKSYHKPGTYNIQLIVTEKPSKKGLVRQTCVSRNIIVMH